MGFFLCLVLYLCFFSMLALVWSVNKALLSVVGSMSLHNLKPNFACSRLTILRTGSIRVSLSMSGIDSFCTIQRRHLFWIF